MRVVVLVMLLLPLAAAQSTQDLRIDSHDGVALNARLYVPEGEGPWPAILLTHGWGESIESGTTRTFAQHFQAQGYIVLAYDSRGFGQSGGQVELDGPNEVEDARFLISHLAARDDVLLDGPGDPRIGMVGQSYAGGIQILTAAQDPRIDAIAPFATWSNLLTSLAPNDVLKRGWIDLLYASGISSSRGIPLGSTDPNAYDPDPMGGSTSKLDEWFVTATATGAATEEMRQEVGIVRSLRPGAVTAPTFLAQGWPDTLFTPDHALETFIELRSRGVDVRLALFHGGHGGFGAYADTEAVMIALDDFMAQHLQDAQPTLPPYPVVRYRYHTDDFVGETSWPPAGTSYESLYLTDDGLRESAGDFSQQLTVPAVPAQCTEVSNFQSQTGGFCGQGVPGTRLALATPPLAEAREVTGTPYVRLSVDTTQTQEIFLFFHLEDVAPDGTATPVLNQVMPVRVPATTEEVSLPMATVSHFFEAGHRIALTISTTDLTYHGAREPGRVTLGGGGDILLLPFVPQDAWGDRAPPVIHLMQTFAAAAGDSVYFLVTDGLGLGNITVQGDVPGNGTAEGNDNVQGNGTGGNRTTQDGAARGDLTITHDDGLRSRVLEVQWDGPCGAVLTLVATDLAGNNATRSFDVRPCPPAQSSPTLLPDDHKRTPVPLALLPLALALVFRRR